MGFCGLNFIEAQERTMTDQCGPRLAQFLFWHIGHIVHIAHIGPSVTGFSLRGPAVVGLAIWGYYGCRCEAMLLCLLHGEEK